MENTVKKFPFLMCLIMLSVAELYPQSAANTIFNTAKSDYNRGQYGFAVSGFNRFIKLSNDNEKLPEAHFYLGLSHYFLGNNSLALHNLNAISRVNNLSPYKPLSFFWKGLIFQNLENYPDAEAEFNNFISTMPNSELVPRALFAVANCRVKQNNLTGALTSLNRLIQSYPNSERYQDSYLLKAYILIQQKEYTAAADLLKSSLENFVADKTLLYLGEIYFELRNYDLSYDYYKRIEEEFEQSEFMDLTILRLSQIERIRGRYPEATALILRLNSLYPTTQYLLESTVDLGLIEYLQENLSSAAVLFNQVVETADRRLAVRDINNNERAKLNTIRAYSNLYLSEIAIKRGETDRAVFILNRIITGRDFKEQATIRLLDIYLSNNNIAKAAELINTASSYLSSDNDFNFFRLKLEYIRADYRRALELVNRITVDDRNRDAVLTIKSLLYSKTGNDTEALRILEESYLTTPINGKAQMINKIVKTALRIRDFATINRYQAEFEAMIRYSPISGRLKLQTDTEFIFAISKMEQMELNQSEQLFISILQRKDNRSLQDLKSIFDLSNYYLGWVYYKKGDYINSSRCFSIASAVVEVTSIKEDSLFMDAYSFFSRNDYRTALEKFNNIYQSNASSDIRIKSLYFCGVSSENLGNKDAASVFYNELLQKFPDSSNAPAAMYRVIRYYIEKNDAQETARLTSLFESLYPDSPILKDVIIDTAQFLRNSNRSSEAFTYYTLYINKFADDNNPGDDFIYYWASDTAFNSKDYTSAISYAEKLLLVYADSPYSENALTIIQRSYREIKDYNGELSAIERLITLSSEKYTALFSTRLAELRLIIRGTAPEEAARINALANGTNEDKLRAIKSYFDSGIPDKAIEAVNRVFGESKDRFAAEALLITANYYLAANNQTAAEQFYFRILSERYQGTQETMAETLYKLAYVYHTGGNNPQALRLLDTIISTYPATVWKERAISLKERVQR